MPLFFLLSGFSCTLGYGRKIYSKANSCCCGNDDQNNNNNFDTFGYLFGRVTRILPVYYFCFLIAIPLIPLGYSYWPPTNYFYSIGGSVASVFLGQTWICILGFGRFYKYLK